MNDCTHFDLPPDLTEPDVVQAAIELGFVTEEEVQAVRELQVREARQDVYRSLVQGLVESGKLTLGQWQRLAQQLAAPDQPLAPPGYRFLRQAGQGSMSTVHLAVHDRLSRHVAVKILARRFTRDKRYVDRFLYEAKLGAQTVSLHLPRVYDVGQAHGQHFMVMEYVEGDSVFDQMTAGKQFSTGDVIDLIVEVATALEHLHSMSIIHRDVKPHNIVISKSGQVKLMDLGLALKLDEGKRTFADGDSAVGTPHYISPEQIRGQPTVGPRSDLYSLGATMYHLLTGRPPFNDTQAAQVMQAQLTQIPIPPGQIVPDLPRSIDRLVMCLLEKDPKLRLSSAERLRQELLWIEAQLDPASARLKRGVVGLGA